MQLQYQPLLSCVASNNQSLNVPTCCHLQVYAQQAEQCSRAADLAGATSYYSKCMEAAVQCGDAASAGAAAHHLGLIHQQQGDAQKALEYQR